MMFDCGEGTQRQMMRFGTGFALDEIFFTHLHADHFLGVIGLLRTMGLQAREEPIRLWVPPGGESLIDAAINLGMERLAFPVQITVAKPGEPIERTDYAIHPFQVSHGGMSLGYALIEKERLGRFDPEKAREMGIPEGPLWGRIHRGESVEVEGRTVAPSELVGDSRPGRKVVLSGDTRPCAATRDMAAGADLLIHEATFGKEDADRARQTGHSTAPEAAKVAREAKARQLILTHFSPRYADDPRGLERQAKKVFRNTTAAYDGLVVDVPYRESAE